MAEKTAVPPHLICVGAIAGAFGVQGEVRLKSFCAVPTAIADYGPLYSENGAQSFKVKLTRPVAGGLGARLSGVQTKEEADALKGLHLYADKAKLPVLPDDEFYYSDLIGLQVRDTGGSVVGRVNAVHNHGAGDILELTLQGRTDPVLLPFLVAYVPLVDVKGGFLIADFPPESDG